MTKNNISKKKVKPTYDFYRLSNIYSNPNLVEKVCATAKSSADQVIESPEESAQDILMETVSCPKKNEDHNTVSRFQTPFVQKSPRTADTWQNQSFEKDVSKTRKLKTTSKKAPRGKCSDWENCVQCSSSEDCGLCPNCLNKSLR